MIKTFRSKALRVFFETGQTKALNAQHLKRIRVVLARLHAAREPRDMALPGLQLHPLKGAYDGFYAVSISGNWRIVFRFEAGDALDVDYVDYH